MRLETCSGSPTPANGCGNRCGREDPQRAKPGRAGAGTRDPSVTGQLDRDRAAHRTDARKELVSAFAVNAARRGASGRSVSDASRARHRATSMTDDRSQGACMHFHPGRRTIGVVGLLFAGLSSTTQAQTPATDPPPVSLYGVVTQEPTGVEASSAAQHAGHAAVDSKPKARRGEFVFAPMPMVNPTLENGLSLVAGYLYRLDLKDATTPPSVSALAGFKTSNMEAGQARSCRAFTWRTTGFASSVSRHTVT